MPGQRAFKSVILIQDVFRHRMPRHMPMMAASVVSRIRQASLRSKTWSSKMPLPLNRQLADSFALRGRSRHRHRERHCNECRHRVHASLPLPRQDLDNIIIPFRNGNEESMPSNLGNSVNPVFDIYSSYSVVSEARGILFKMYDLY
jgi:hypothetical protein